MSVILGKLMVTAGFVLIISLVLKLLVQPFVPEDHPAQAFFPSTFWVLTVPVVFGTTFFLSLGFYIMIEMNS